EDGRRHSVTASAREALRAGQAPVPGPLPQLREQPAAAVAPRPAQTAGVAAAAVQRPGEPAAVAQLRLEMSRFRDGRHAGEGEMAALMTGHRARSGSQVKAAPAEPVDVSAVAPPTPSRPRPSQGQAVDSFKRASR
ncbi:MAG TPA: hypothetical protein VD902_10270, partial [Symbiobacteriaceae bacterium]|nr:hypothetical protein [Symbiobacteriaceae bacterium]